MSDDFEPYDEDEMPSSGRISRRDGFAIDLTGIGVRIAATLVVIGLGILIIYFALRPGQDEGVVEVLPTPEDTALVDEANGPLATFTPGATSTPPPLDEPVVAPESEPGDSEGDVAGLAVGEPAIVTGTDGLGVNLRQAENTSSEVIQILTDDTPLTVVEGPVEGEGYTWWRVRLEDGTEGWVVEEFLAPTE
ncbi:MAG: SH3 domain-containing protein [Chloroflexota bacterium]|nr:SH3 domain-containing protein [Chloroflexota bacterium]